MVEEGKEAWKAEVIKDTLESLQLALIAEQKDEFYSEAGK